MALTWPESPRLIGTKIPRLDGLAKASGRAKYPSDMNPQGLLQSVLLTSPYAHAKIRSINLDAAKALPGVVAIKTFVQPGAEIQWAGAEIAIVAANTEEIARDAVRAIKIDWEILPHVVKEENLAKAGCDRGKFWLNPGR